jgi:hypothetical protein
MIFSPFHDDVGADPTAEDVGDYGGNALFDD